MNMTRRSPVWNDTILIDKNAYYDKVERRRQMSINRNGLCFCGSRKKQKSCHSNIYENSYAAHIIMNYMEIDEGLREAHQKQGSRLFCNKGCNDCCDDVFDIGIGEYFVLRAALLRRQTNDLSEYIQYAEEAISSIKENAEMQAVFSGNKRMLETGKGASFVTCPFIGEAGLCSEYMDRTLVCRGYGHLEFFGVCKKIRKAQNKISNRLRKRDLLLRWDDSISQYIMAYIQYLPIIKSGEVIVDDNGVPYVRQTLIESHPLLYWLANDSCVVEQYTDAVQMDVIDYCIKYGR